MPNTCAAALTILRRISGSDPQMPFSIIIGLLLFIKEGQTHRNVARR